MMNGPSATVNDTLAQNGCEAEPVWERPWTLEEIHKASGTWSLGADAGLLLFLQDFSQRMLSRTHEIEKQLDGLIQHTKATDSRLHNVFNDFLMLSNIQFIENRVYDEEVEEAAKPESGGKPIEPEKTREQKEAELIPKVQEAVHHGLRVLDSAFEQLDIKAGNSDSEDEETNERVEHLLEPKDLYIDRPLPYIIGSQQFMEEEDVGLGDLSSEESVDSEHGSVIESEEEKEEESGDDFIDESEDDEQKPPKSVQKQHLISDEDEDDDSDLFHESEKEDDDDGELTSPKKMGQTSFAEELAARIQGESSKIQDEESAVLTSGGSAKKNRVKVKKETQKVKRQDDDENLFTPENADEDDDYSPFYSKSGLFSGGKGLFDDDEADLFAEAPKEEVDKGREAKPVVSNGGDLFVTNVISKREHDEKAKVTRAKVTRASPVREPADAGGLFDDEEDDDLFGSSVKTSTAATTDPILAAGLFDDSEDSGLFVTPKPAKEKPGVQQNAEPHSEVLESSPQLADKSQTSSGLFSDDDEPRGDLFSPALAKDIAAAKKSQQSHEPKPPTSRSKSTALFDSDDMDEWQSSGLQAPVAECAVDSEAAQPSLRKQVTSKAAAAPRAPKKTSLFDDYNEEDDLFGVTQKESQKKSQKVSLLFEDDDGDLFASKPVANKSAPQKPAALPQDSLLFSKIVDSDSVEEFDGKRQLGQGVGAEPMPEGTTRLFAGIEQQSNTKVLDSQGVTTQESDGLFGQSVTGLQEELQSNLNPVVSLFDEEDEENLEGTLNQCSLVNDEKLPESGVSTRVFQDEELLFSQHQQKDNDPDVDLFADALKPEVKKSGIKPPDNSPPAPQTKAVELPSSDLFDGADNLFTSKAQSAKAASSTASIFEDSVDEDLFVAVPKKPPVAQKKPMLKGTGISQVTATKASEHPKEARDGALNKQRPEEKEANLAINPASLLPGASPKVAVVTSGSVSPSSPPGSPLSEATSSASGPAVSDGASVSFDQPMQANTLTNVNKSRARVGQKRRPPTRVARRLAAQQSDEVEDLDQRLEVDSASSIADFSPTGLAQKPNPDKRPMAKWALPPEPSPGDGAGPAPAPAPAPIAKPPVHSDLFNSDNLFKPSSTQELSPAAGAREDLLPKEEPSQSIFAPSKDDLFQSSKRTVKKPKPVAFLEEEGGEDLFGIAKLGQTKPAAQKSSKTLDIFEDDLFSTESVTLTKKSNEGSTDVDLFSDHVDIFADLKVAPKEKKSRKKVETKSIFDDDMDDIFASAMPSASSKKQSKPKTKSKQAAAPTTPGSKAVDIFDDPLNAFGP
ncbi:WASH complex subunit 2 isoform X10 [Cetorhinus maximus]